jgi:hypothetical protein
MQLAPCSILKYFKKGYIAAPTHCARATSEVLQLRQLWTPDRKGHWNQNRFFTLGNPLYQMSVNIDDYMKAARQTNDLMKDTFGWLYSLLLDGLSSLLGENVFLTDCLAVPGFHIYFPGHAGEEMHIDGPPHFDLQHRHLEALGFHVAVPRIGSATLPVMLPRRGSGLRVYNLTYGQHGRQISTIDLKMLRELESVLFTYSTGELIAHCGHYCHQMANPGMGEASSREMRITLQAHLANHRHKVYLYW